MNYESFFAYVAYILHGLFIRFGAILQYQWSNPDRYG